MTGNAPPFGVWPGAVEFEAGQRLLMELTHWTPPGGVVSVYLAIDPGDRGEGWRIELRDQLEDVDEAAARRVLERFPSDTPTHGRTHIGFLEVDGEAREVWETVQVALQRTEVVQRRRPYVTPLMRILDDGWPVGVVVVALERVRMLEWVLGEITELDGWEIELPDLDWQERKSPQRNPQAGGTGTTASGRDQHAQRLEHNRDRFLKQAGELVAAQHGDRPWRRIIVIGDGDRPRLLAAGLGAKRKLVHEIRHDLIRAGAPEIGARVGEEMVHLNRTREEELVAQLEQAIGSDVGAALGLEEVLQVLGEGRARHVIFDATRSWDGDDSVPAGELMIERALATSALVTPVEGLAATALAAHGGAAALLRY